MPALHISHRQPVSALVYSTIGPAICGIVLFLVGGFIAASAVMTSESPVLVSSTLMGVIAFASGIVIAYPVLYYFLFSYIVTEQTITVNSGILFRQYETINFSRVQVIDNERNPILMLFGLTRVEIWTASPDQLVSPRQAQHSRPDAVLLLSKHTAEELKNYILHRPLANSL